MTTEATRVADAPASSNYEGVGHSLRVVRERQGLAVAEISNRIRIRRPHLEAIEAGRFDLLPGPVYITGFLRTYAEFLGLDAEQVVKAFQQESDLARQRRVLQFPMPRPEARTPRLWLVVAALLLAAVVYAFWYRNQEGLRIGAELVKAVPARLAELVPSPTPIMAAPRLPDAVAATASRPQVAAAPRPAESALAPPAPPSPPLAPQVTTQVTPQITSPATPAIQPGASAPAPAAAVAAAPPSIEKPAAPPPAASAAAFGADGGRLRIEARADSWVQVRAAEGEPVFTRLMAAGERYTVPARSGLTLATGNAGGLRLMLDGEQLAELGGEGEVKRGIPLNPEDLKAALKRD